MEHGEGEKRIKLLNILSGGIRDMGQRWRACKAVVSILSVVKNQTEQNTMKWMFAFHGDSKPHSKSGSVAIKFVKHLGVRKAKSWK